LYERKSRTAKVRSRVAGIMRSQPFKTFTSNDDRRKSIESVIRSKILAISKAVDDDVSGMLNSFFRIIGNELSPDLNGKMLLKKVWTHITENMSKVFTSLKNNLNLRALNR
jgi:hypothetical protein